MNRLKHQLALAVMGLAALVGCDGTAVVGGYAPDATMKDIGNDAVDAPDAVVCPSPLIGCNGRCTDPRNDRQNCGACNRACGTGETCQNNACVPDCASGETLCGSSGDAGASLRCVSLQTDRMNCGACGNACGRD